MSSFKERIESFIIMKKRTQTQLQKVYIGHRMESLISNSQVIYRWQLSSGKIKTYYCTREVKLNQVKLYSNICPKAIEEWGSHVSTTLGFGQKAENQAGQRALVKTSSHLSLAEIWTMHRSLQKTSRTTEQNTNQASYVWSEHGKPGCEDSD